MRINKENKIFFISASAYQVSQVSVYPPMYMLTPAGLYSGMNGGYDLRNIEKEHHDDVGNVRVGDLLLGENNGNGPPESETVYKQK
jgi:hypothetical protein